MRLKSNRLQLALSVIILGVFAVYFLANRHQFDPLLHIKAGYLALIALVYLAIMAVNSLFTKVVLQRFHKFIGFVESYYVTLIASVGNYFAPVGAGFAFRAVYLKKKHGLSYGDYISILSGNYILVFLVSSVLGLWSVLMLRGQHSPKLAVISLFFVAMLVGTLLLGLVRIPHHKIESISNRPLRKILKILVQIADGWKTITASRELLLKLLTLVVGNAVLTFLGVWLIVSCLHLHVAFAGLLVYSVLGALSLFISVTPANLGVKEAVYLFSASVLGLSVSQVLSIALIDRGIQFLVLAVSWLLIPKNHQATAVVKPGERLVD